MKGVVVGIFVSGFLFVGVPRLSQKWTQKDVAPDPPAWARDYTAPPYLVSFVPEGEVVARVFRVEGMKEALELSQALLFSGPEAGIYDMRGTLIMMVSTEERVRGWE